MWANNGDTLSKVYAGTGALRSEYTRTGKRTLGGLMDDVLKNVNRFVVNNFQDDAKQAIIEIILGNSAKDQDKDVFIQHPALQSIDYDVNQWYCRPAFLPDLRFQADFPFCFPVPRRARRSTRSASTLAPGMSMQRGLRENPSYHGLSLRVARSLISTFSAFRSLWSSPRNRSSKQTAMSAWPGSSSS